MKLIYQAEGAKGFTRGYKNMVMMDVPGFGVYFGAFELAKRILKVSDSDKLENYQGKSSYDVVLRKFISGGLAGCSGWTFALPMDIVKTRMMSRFDNKGSLAVLTELIKENGVRGLWRGWSV